MKRAALLLGTTVGATAGGLAWPTTACNGMARVNRALKDGGRDGRPSRSR